MRITPLQPHLAARVEDVDLATPLDRWRSGNGSGRWRRRSSRPGEKTGTTSTARCRIAAWNGIIPEGVGAAS